MHFFLKSLEEFLVYRELQDDEMHAKAILAKVFRKRRIFKSFEKNLKSAIQVQEKQTFRNSNFHQNDYLIRQEAVRFYALQSRNQNIDFQGLSDSLDVYYLADKLRQSMLLISHQTVYKKTYNLGMLDQVLQFLQEEKNFLKIPAIGMYYYALKCATDREEPSHFLNFKNEIEQNSQYFPHFEVRDLYLAAINYCINRYNNGKQEYLRELFQLYQNGITRNVLMDDGIISRFTFQNLVASGTKLKEYEWVSNFILEYQNRLDIKHRENIVHYSQSFLNFEMGNYEEAMKLLNQVEYDDILMNLSGKTMLVRMFYELGYDDALDSLVTSTKAYIQRKKVIGYHKTNYSNLLKFISKISKINPYDKREKLKLYDKVKSVNPVAEKKWLLKQIQAL